jgi:hypothetical protein
MEEEEEDGWMVGEGRGGGRVEKRDTALLPSLLSGSSNIKVRLLDWTFMGTIIVFVLRFKIGEVQR